MTQFNYRLQRLLEQKEEARTEAERELIRREQALQAQAAVLQSLQQRERDMASKREQLRRELLAVPRDGGALNANEVMKRSEDVKVVGLQIEDAKKDILLQRGVVEQCEAHVSEGKKLVEEARREVEVLAKHRTKQQERFNRALQVQEEIALDEIGNVLNMSRRRSV